MRKYILIFSIILISIVANGQEYKIKTIDKSKQDYYQWITFLSEGDIFWGNSGGNAYRLAITTSEIYDDIFIEKVTVGTEGGGKKIVWKRQIDRENLTDLLKFDGEISGIKLVKWLSWDSFVLKIQNRNLLFKNIGSNIIIVKELK